MLNKEAIQDFQTQQKTHVTAARHNAEEALLVVLISFIKARMWIKQL